MVVPDVSSMFHCAASVGEDDDDPVRDRLSAWKLLPATAPVWRIWNPTESPAFLSVTVTAPRACQLPLAVTHCLAVCTSEPPGFASCSSRHRLFPGTPSTSPVPCSWVPCATLVAGLGLA